MSIQTQAFYTPDLELIAEKLTPVFLRGAELLIDTVRGDIATGNTDDQEIDFILLAKKGQFYNAPLIGYNIERLQNARIDPVIETGKLIQELTADGFPSRNIRDVIIGNTSDRRFTDQISPATRGTLPQNAIVINVKANR